ncbi:MAG: hypothetical protein ACK5Q5_16880, partial [Planctomycetaceae bacterium]
MDCVSLPDSPSRVWVDCHGEPIDLPQVVCNVAGREWIFVFDPACKQSRKFHFGLFANMAALGPHVFAYPRHRRIAALFETPLKACYRELPEIERRFPTIYTHQQELINRGPPYVPLLLGMNWMSVWTDADAAAVLQDHPEKRELVSFMGGLDHPDEGAYRLRRQAAEFALQRGNIACFGKGIRTILNKRDALAPFRFSIAMENASSNLYFTEKLVDCLLLETIPIYYGCP